MDCVVASATLHEGVLDLTAEVGGGGEMRFLMPKVVLEWTQGQRFRCEAVSETNQEKADPSAITLRGEVVERDATAALLSFGGLPMRLPPCLFPLVPPDESEVTLRLVPYVAEPRKRPLRPRRGASVGRET